MEGATATPLPAPKPTSVSNRTAPSHRPRWARLPIMAMTLDGR
jgi:hypothetical protein